uniref:SMB domain-containing protein n=1 Tax=Syphacia muris TaxID=451379 RepID=A0A0N5AZQ7_9BILA
MPRLRYIGILAILFAVIEVSIAAGFNGIVGDYCRTRTPACCPDRDDDCKLQILGDQFCYCDLFCDRGPRGNDCCPDFEDVCRNATSKEKYSPNSIQTNTIHEIINRWSCESEICLVQSSVLQQLRDGDYLWTAKNYTKFWGKTLAEGVRYRLGTLFPEKSARNMNEIVMKPRTLPNSFDARERWPEYIHPIRDQGNCGSSWAFSTTATSADRLSIMSNGRINVVLSPQQMLSCSQQKSSGCKGGHLDKAWWYMRKIGVVSEDCYNYKSGHNSKPGKCHIPHSTFFSDDGLECPSTANDANNTLYRMTPAYRISNKEEDIMTEIMTNGPVQATFLVYGDFFMYHKGIYKHLTTNTNYDFAPKGYHSVRLIGWGTDIAKNGHEIKYWLAANSWGTDWGEDGYFRIIRGENHCEIESFVIGAWGRSERQMKKVQKLHKRRKHPKSLFRHL